MIWNTYSEEVQINEDLSYLCGIVLTDGHMQVGSNRFEVSSCTSEILQKVARISETNGWSYKLEDKRILVYGSKAVNLLLSLGVSMEQKKSYSDLAILGWQSA